MEYYCILQGDPKKGEILYRAKFTGNPRFECRRKEPNTPFNRFFGIVSGYDSPDDEYYYNSERCTNMRNGGRHLVIPMLY